MSATPDVPNTRGNSKNDRELFCFYYNRHLRSDGPKCVKDPCTRRHERMPDSEYEQQKQRLSQARRRTPSPPPITYCKQYARGEPCPRMEKYGKCVYAHKTKAEIKALEDGSHTKRDSNNLSSD